MRTVAFRGKNPGVNRIDMLQEVAARSFSLLVYSE